MTAQEVAALFDARADRYASDSWHRPYAERLVAATPLKEGDVVLDAGTGTGLAACAISHQVGVAGHVLGVDVSERMLEKARMLVRERALENVEFLQADVTELTQLASSTFDVVVCSAGLLYMPVAKALREWHRLLKPAGVVSFSTMRQGSPLSGRIFRECAARLGIALHDPSEPLGTAERCTAALEEAHFEILATVPDCIEFRSFNSGSSWEANLRAAGHERARTMAPEEQAQLRRSYFDALRAAEEANPVALLRADVLLALGRASCRP